MDLTTTYLGLSLRNPLVASPGPISQSVDGIRALADGGVGAVVLYSLFEEQLRKQLNDELDMIESMSESFAEATSYFPEVALPDDANIAYDYLQLIEGAVRAVDVPVIGSLNGADLGGWVTFAQQIADAGAAALELNIYAAPGDVHAVGPDVVARHLDVTRAVVDAVSIPVAVKLSPYFTSVGDVVLRVLDAGASGAVLFNRFLQPDIDIEKLSPVTGVELSSAVDGRLPRAWIAALRRHTPKSLALTSGVEAGADVVKGLLAGADVVMTTSALLRHGSGYSHELLDELETWMQRKGFASVDALRGLLADSADADGAARGRAGYVADLQTAKTQYADRY